LKMRLSHSTTSSSVWRTLTPRPMRAEGRNDFTREWISLQKRPDRKGVCPAPDRRAEKDNVISVEIRHIFQRRKRTSLGLRGVCSPI
jgi:hypothetical protein